MKILEVLLSVLNVWGRSRPIRKIPGHPGHLLPNAFAAEMDRRKRKRKGRRCVPVEFGTPSIKRPSAFPFSGLPLTVS